MICRPTGSPPPIVVVAAEVSPQGRESAGPQLCWVVCVNVSSLCLSIPNFAPFPPSPKTKIKTYARERHDGGNSEPVGVSGQGLAVDGGRVAQAVVERGQLFLFGVGVLCGGVCLGVCS